MFSRQNLKHKFKITILYRYQEAGILQVWFAHIANLEARYMAHFVDRSFEKSTLKPLTVDNLTGVLFLFLLGVSISIITFAVELLFVFSKSND